MKANNRPCAKKYPGRTFSKSVSWLSTILEHTAQEPPYGNLGQYFLHTKIQMQGVRVPVPKILTKVQTRCAKFKQENVYNIVYSQAVTHPSTNTTQRCLTSVIGRELVLSTWYGRRHSLRLKTQTILNRPQSSDLSSLRLGQENLHGIWSMAHCSWSVGQGLKASKSPSTNAAMG